MTPFEQARALHRSDPDNEPFEEVLMAHLLHGVVVSTPTVFVLMRPVGLWAEHKSFDDSWLRFANPDCWHCYLAAGDLREMFAAIPYPLPYCSFVRKNRLHIRELKHMTERVSNLSRHGRQTKGTQEGQCDSSSVHAEAGATDAQG